MQLFWVDECDFQAAMREISDLLRLGLEDDEIVHLETELPNTWFGSGGPRATVPNRGVLDVAIEIAEDEIPGVVFYITGSADEISGVKDIVNKYRY